MTAGMTTFVSANGLRVAYLEEGSGPLVLLLHGFPDTPHTWDVVRPAVAALGYRVVTPFLRGYSPTEIPADGAYDADTLGRDTVGLIAALGEQRAIVVGHDWGASAATSAAALSPEHVTRLITLAIPHPASLRPTLPLLWAGRHFFAFKLPGAEARTRARNFAYVDELVRRWSPAWDVPAAETEAVKEVFRQPGSLNAALGYYRAVSPTLPASYRKRIRVPTVAFAGTEDIVDPAVFDRAASWYTAGYEVVRVPGGHFMHREHPGHFVRELTRVLGRPGVA
jgi:pimeloyl-ACP methyl ester carboxylesterase